MGFSILNKFKIVWQVIAILLIVFWIYFLSRKPNKKDQEQVTHEIYKTDRSQIIIGTVSSKYHSDNHNVPQIVVRNETYSINDILYSKIKVGDSISKLENSDFYLVYRDGVLKDSVDLRMVYGQ